MSKGPSTEQREIIKESINNILVSAAAGSGKTYVLVNRILKGIIEEKLSVDKILVATFTNEATRDMKARIEEAIVQKINEEKGKPDPDKGLISRLNSQLNMIPNAYIQTLNAFCSRVIKEKSFVCAGDNNELLQPGSVILEENQCKLLLKEAAEAAVKSFYSDETDADFYTLTGMFGNGRTDGSLVDSLVVSYSKMRSIPNYIENGKDVYKNRLSNSDTEIAGISELVTSIVRTLRLIDVGRVADIKTLSRSLIYSESTNDKTREKSNADAMAKISGLVDAYKTYAAKIVKMYDASSRTPSELADIYKQIIKVEGIKKSDIQYQDLVNASKLSDKSDYRQFSFLMGPIAAFVKLFKNLLGLKSAPRGYGECALGYDFPKEYSSFIDVSPEDLISLQKERFKLSGAYIRILEKMDECYSQIKASMRGLDFSDQEHLALQILQNEDAAQYYRGMFKEIYIDEYQDNSRLQDKVIACIGNNNVFRVGDVKQSIYKFRNAEPKLFLDLMKEYSEDDGKGKLMTLNANFRSTHQILDFVNMIFKQAMTANGSEIEYDDTHKLNEPEDPEARKTGDLPRVVIVDNGGKEKVDDSSCGCDYGVLNEVKYYLSQEGIVPGDIRILARKNKSALRIAQFLTANGYKAEFTEELSIFEDRTIRGICNLFMAIGNIYRDEYILGAMLSPYLFSNFSMDEVARLRLDAKKFGVASQYLFIQIKTCLRKGAYSDELKTKLNKFISFFEEIRNDIYATDVSVVFDKIVRETGIMAMSEETNVELSLFKDWLCSNFMRYGSDISGIAAALESLDIKLSASASIKSENSDETSIKCTTYHGSKGLNFKCVIVADLEAEFKKNGDNPALYDSDGNIILNDYNESDVSLKTSIERLMYDDRNKLGENAEAIRLLYVALTRAQHYMSVVLSTGISKPSKRNYRDLLRLMEKYPFMGLDRNFWLNNKIGSDYILMSALLRTTAGRDIADKLVKAYQIKEDDSYDPIESIPFDGFETVFIDDLAGRDIGDADLEDDEEEDSSEEDGSEEEVSESALKTALADGNGVKPQIVKYENGIFVFDDGRTYGYSEGVEEPFKKTVSQMASESESESDDIPMNFLLPSFESLIDKYNGKVGESASSIGTLVHKIMRYIAPENAASDEDYKDYITSLVKEGVITSNETSVAIGFAGDIIRFVNSSLGKRLFSASYSEQEKPVLFAVSTGNDYTLVQGIIDCVFEENGEYVIIDYKTDNLSNLNAGGRINVTRKKHSFQVNSYAASLEASGMKVKEKYIVLLRTGDCVEIK